MFDPSQTEPPLLSKSSENSVPNHQQSDENTLTTNPKEVRGMLSTECLIKSWLLQCNSAFSEARATGTDFEFPPCKPVHHRGRTVSSPSLLSLPVEEGYNKEGVISSGYSKHSKRRGFTTARPFSAKTDAISSSVVKNKPSLPHLPKCINAPTKIQSDPLKSNTTLENVSAAAIRGNITASSVMLTEAQEKKNIDGRSGALISKAEEGFSTNSANDWYSMTSSDWADEVCEFDREESYRVQQMFDAIDTILYETDDMLIGESKFPVQRSNECSTFPLGKNVSKVSQYLWQNNGVILDPAIKTLSSVAHNKATAIQGSLRPKQMFAGVEHLLSECKEWASKFPHLRIRGAGITAAERTSSAARKAITFTPRTLSKTVTGKGPNIPELHRSGYALETSELGKPLINGALTNQVSPGLNTPGYMPHLLIRGQQLSPRMPQTLPGMHLTTWSQHPRKISSGRHSAPKSTRPSVTQHSKVHSLLTDDLAIARVGSCSYAADTTTTVKLARRILSTPDPRSRTLNLLTRSKTETSRLSGRSRLSPVESASPGPRTPTDGKQNWRTGDQFNLHSKNLRVKSEQSTRKLRLARSVQKLSELTSDNPPQHAVHLNTVSDIKAVLKEEILSILCADAAAALFAIASGKADRFQKYLRSVTDVRRRLGNPENTTPWFRARLSDSPTEDGQWRHEDERTEALTLNRAKLFSPIPDFSTLGNALNISSKTLQQRTAGIEGFSGRITLNDAPKPQMLNEDSCNRQSTHLPGCLGAPNIEAKNSRKQQRSSRPNMSQRSNVTLPPECSSQPRLAHTNLANTTPPNATNVLSSGRLVPIESTTGTLPALAMNSANEDSSAFQVVSFRWRLNSKQQVARVPPVPEHQVLSTSQPNLAGGDSFHRSQVLPPIVLNTNYSKGLTTSLMDNDGDFPQDDRPKGLGKAKTCRVGFTSGIKRVTSSLFPAGGLPSISSTVSSHVAGPDGPAANSKSGPHRSVTKFPEYASAYTVQHSPTLPPTALATQKVPVTALHAVSVHKHWDQFSSSSKVFNLPAHKAQTVQHPHETPK